MDVTESDHKPVFGIFEARVRPGRDHADGLACGQFHRQVYEEANRRRANHFLLRGGGGGRRKGKGKGKGGGENKEGGGGGSGGGETDADNKLADGDEEALDGDAQNSKICAVM